MGANGLRNHKPYVLIYLWELLLLLLGAAAATTAAAATVAALLLHVQ